MKLLVKAKPNAKADSIEKLPDGSFLVAVKARPENDRANQAVIEVLASHLGVASSRLKIILGRTSRRKILELN